MTPTVFAKCENYTVAREAKQKGIYPYFHELQSKQDTEVIMEGKRKIMLGSNNYLGLTVNEEVKNSAIKAIEQYGTGCSGSRFLNGTLNLHLELEKKLADFLGYESAMTFSTGFQSNLGIISAVVGKDDFVICDRENHASIYDGCRLCGGTMLRYKHGDMNSLEKALQKVPKGAGILIVTDGVFSMSGDIANLPEIVRLKKKYGAALMVDDAHGLGVIGEGGRGTGSHFGLSHEVDLVMGTFSKSLASLGGYLAASETVCEYVRHNSRPFIFSASMPPACCAAAESALDVLIKQPELPKRLCELANYMRNALRAKNIRIKDAPTPIIPIYISDAETTLTVSKRLFDEGVFVNSVLPPATAPSECLLRVSLMASHTKELIDEAVEIIERVLKEFDIIK